MAQKTCRHYAGWGQKKMPACPAEKMKCRPALQITFISALIKISPDQKLFGHSIKNGYLPPKTELTTFEYNCTKPPCAITQIHCPTSSTNYTKAIVTFYIDDQAPISMTLLELAFEGHYIDNEGPIKDGSPWGTHLFGKTSTQGGIYSTLRIPFQKTFKSTLQSTPDATKDAVFWWIIRGIEKFPVVIQDLQLPDSAQLKLYRFQKTVAPFEIVNLAEIPKGRAGVIMAMRFDSDSKDMNFLEACVRAYPDQSTSPIFLSSGAEDYFLSAFYFDEGMFKTPNSGLSFFNGKDTLSAYKIHDRDPIPFNDGFTLQFRNNENTVGCGDTQHCPNQFCRPKEMAKDIPLQMSGRKQQSESNTANANYQTVVFVYEWDKSSYDSSEQEQDSKQVITTHKEIASAIENLKVLLDQEIISNNEFEQAMELILFSKTPDQSIIALALSSKNSIQLKYLKKYIQYRFEQNQAHYDSN